MSKFNELIEKNDKSQVHRHLRLTMMNGETHVYWNGHELIGNWKKRHARELLLYLIMNQKTANRDAIVDAFAENLTISQARNHLRVQLNYLNTLFRSQVDSTLHDVLVSNRDSITLNCDVESDLGEFISTIEDLLRSKEPIEQRIETFLIFLEDYHPDFLVTWNGTWIRNLEKKLTNQLSQVLNQILRTLKEEYKETEIRRILSNQSIKKIREK
ncbi:hypothetical protein EWI07_00855 [Sporolactobacillus sp. THM7-4]|nr:hypothetical protein EWI07_00855 [Sporolactobacillus sp. THM7-4]